MFHIFNSTFRVKFSALGTLITTVLHYYHIVLNFTKLIVISEGIFRALLLGKYFWGFSVSGKGFFGVGQKYPTLLDPVCKVVRSTPWVYI